MKRALQARSPRLSCWQDYTPSTVSGRIFPSLSSFQRPALPLWASLLLPLGWLGTFCSTQVRSMDGQGEACQVLLFGRLCFPMLGSSELWQWVDGGSTRCVMDIVLRKRHVLLELMEMDDVAGCRNGVTTPPASDPSMFMSSGLRDPFTGGVLPLPTSV